jgi:23S rRNA (uracil1939-C5)-methyltransferase
VVELAPTGEGIARVDGRALFVPGTLTGELALVAPEGQARARRAKLLSVVRPSDARVEPACPHVERCGGCDWMHIEPEEQVRQHLHTLMAQLRHALGDELPEPVAHRPTAAIAYRDRARLTAISRGTNMLVGYRRARSRRVAEVDSCAVLVPELQAVLPLLAPLLAGSRGEGEVRLALGAEGKPVAEVRWSGELAAEVFARIEASVRADQPTFGGVRLWPDGARKPSDYGDPYPRIEGPDGGPMRLAPGGFGQTSAAGGAALARRVAAIVRDCAAAERVVELFAGSGTLTVAAAVDCGRYEAVEQVEEAAQALRDNLSARGIDARVVAADANERAISPATHTVILDPPRSGAPGAIERIVAARPHHVVYVSCNPNTLARDLTVLQAAGYRVRSIDGFELFPQTSHLEAVVHLERHRER